MNRAEEIIGKLKQLGSKEKSEILQRFFKTAKGEYGEGDLFIGVKVPEIREIVKKSGNDVSFETIDELVKSEYHESRMAALFFLIKKFEKAKNEECIREQCVNTYLNYTEYINNWDLVDLSCPKILGPWFENRNRKTLYDLADSGTLWQERIAMVTCLYFINKNDFKECLIFADKFISHKHDLMHKATGWMLREVGKRNIGVLKEFLNSRYKNMPRTMLRYAIEKFPEEERQQYLKGTINTKA